MASLIKDQFPLHSWELSTRYAHYFGGFIDKLVGIVKILSITYQTVTRLTTASFKSSANL